MVSGIRCSATPGTSQQATLRVWIGHQRFAQNGKSKEAHYWRTFGRKALALTGQVPLPDQAYNQLITEDSQFLKDVPSQILRNGAYRFAVANTRYLKGLGGAPGIKKKSGRQSVLLTKELFEFAPYTNLKTQEVQYALYLGTRKCPLGRLHFKAHGPFAIPDSLCISVEPDGKWFVSFCYETQEIPGAPDEPILRSPQELAYEFNLLTDEQLNKLTIGLDRGVALPVASSAGETFTLDTACTTRIAKKERGAQRYQRRMSKQTPGGKNYCKNRKRKARKQAYAKNVRKDFAHKTSHDLVESDAHILVFEDLKLKNMTKAPAAKQDAQGRYTANGAAAKAGLNKALLRSALGAVKEFATYKAAKKNKLVLFVSPYNSSNECAQCGHTEAANRKTQSQFECVKCHHRDNADFNASKVLKKRGIAQLRSGAPVRKPKKTAKVGGKNKPKKAKELVGPVRPEPGG